MKILILSLRNSHKSLQDACAMPLRLYRSDQITFTSSPANTTLLRWLNHYLHARIDKFGSTHQIVLRHGCLHCARIEAYASTGSTLH